MVFVMSGDARGKSFGLVHRFWNELALINFNLRVALSLGRVCLLCHFCI